MISLRNNPVFRRLLHGTGANFLGKVWVLAIQLASVPIMTSAWGVEGFGVWLMISTIPTYLALSDFGLGVAAGVDITSAMARNDKPHALAAFQAVWAFLTVTTLLVGALCILVAGLWLRQTGDGASGPFAPRDVFLAIVMIVGAALLTMQMSIRKIVFQATHKYALGTAVFDLLYFAGFLAVLGAVLLGYGLVEASAVQLIARGLSLLLFTRLQTSLEPWCTVGWKHADRATLKRLFSPSMSALALTVANSFGLQGVVLTIGWAFNPAAAAVFATTRMLTRIPLQFSGLVTRASLPELTRAQVADDKPLTKKLMKLNMGLALAVMAPAVLALSVFGPRILDYMSHGEMAADHLSFILLGLAASFCAIWTTIGTRLIAVNRQAEYSYVALGLYLVCAVVPFVSGGNLMPVLFAIVIADAVIALRVGLAETLKRSKI